MRFFDYIRISLKNIWRQKIRSILTIVAIIIGSLAVISVLSLIFGAKTVFVKQLEAEGSFTLVTVRSGNFGGGGPFQQDEQAEDTQKKIDDNTIKEIETLNHVLGVSPVIKLWELQNIRLKDGDGKKLKADNIEAYEPGEGTKKTILAGRDFNKEDGKGRVIFSSNMAENFGFKSPEEAISKKVIFTTKKGYTGDGAEIPPPWSDKEEWDKMQEKTTELEAEIIGVTTSPGPGQDSSIFITLDWGRKIASWSHWEIDETKMKAFEEQMKKTNKPWDGKDCKECQVLKTEGQIDREGYNLLYVKTDDSNDTKGVAEEIKKLGFQTITAEDMIKMFTRVAYIIAAILGAIGAISLGVATIGIINTMIMAAMERTREIGVMRACGATRKTIRRLFTFEAATLGFLGGLIGLMLGFGISKIANYFINKMLASQSMAAQNVISFPWWLIGGALTLTTILGFLSGLYPAHRAAKLDPVEALRYE